MTAKQRIASLKYLEKQKRHPDFAKALGVEVKIEQKNNQKGIETVENRLLQ